jgi:predicted acetyltransferase
MHEHSVTLDAVTEKDAELLGNLLELYVHDLSAMFLHVELGPDGRFGYPQMRSYLGGCSDRFAFLVRCDEHVAGFALAKRGSPAAKDPDVLDVAEFFVLRRYRGRGVGRAAAELLWDRLRGSWTVRASVKNPQAVSFWRGAIAAYTSNSAREFEHVDGSGKWTVFSFENRC